MYNPFVTPTISLRTRGYLSFPFDEYSHCSNEGNPFVYSSSRTCCSCCGNSMYKAPVAPTYCCNLYGLRQSSLIQCSPYRKLIPCGFDRCYYARLHACNVDRRCYCERVSCFRDKSVGGRKGGLRKCNVFEERSEMYELGVFEEAEAMLSLLAEDVDEECFRVTKETKRLLKKPAVGKGGDGGFSLKFEIKENKVDLDEEDEHVCECGSKIISKKKDNRRRQETMQREEEKEAKLREENRKRMSLEERRMRRKEEREALLRRESQKAKEKRERESLLRKEVSKVSSRAEEREDLLRREEDRQKVRRDGSSCSSYYSVSSNGDYASDTKIELKKGKSLGDTSSGHKRITRINEINYEDTRKEDIRREDSREENVVNLTKNSVVESDFRKKSEKKLADISVVDTESKKESSLKESKLSMTNERNYEERRKEELRQTSDDASRQSETRFKYKQFTEMQDTRIDDRRFYGSQKVYSDNSSQETLGEHRKAVELGSREDEYQRNSRRGDQISGFQGINITNTSISQQSSETNMKEEKNYSNNIHISINEAPKQQQQSDQVSGLVESSGTSQELTQKKGKWVLRTESDKLIKQEENVNLTYGSSSESNQARAGIIKSATSETGHNDSTKISISPSGDSVANVEEKSKAKSETLVRRPSLASSDEITTKTNKSDGQPSKITSREDTIASAARLQESSAHYVGEFVHQVTNEIEKEKKTEEIKSETKGHDNQQSGPKGPSDEMWNEDEPSVQELSKAENKDNSSKNGNAVPVRTGRSLWNVISDVVHLRWSHNSESHSSSRKTVGRSSSHLSTSSEAWFSGHEAEENEEAKERQSIAQEEKVPKKVEEGASSSTVGINVPSSSVAISPSPSTSSAAIIDSSISSPALRLQRSPVIHGTSSEAGEAVEQPESAGRKLQRKDQISRELFGEWEEAYRLEAAQRQTDEMFMREALLEAQKAAEIWEVPVGAVLVHNGKIIARGCNLVEELRDSTAHAEMICIREASNLLKSWRLAGTTLYVTLEPCPMCAGAILQARIDAVVWGAPNKLLGADGSWIRLFPNNDGGNALEQTDKPPAPIHPFHPKIIIRRGVLTAECAEAMQQFFQLRRKKEKKPGPTATSVSEGPASASASPSATAAHSRLPIPHRHPKFSARMMHFFFCL